MLRVAIIGSGFGQYGLFPAFRSIEGCEVVALCGQKRPQLVGYCESIGFTNIYEDWREMLRCEKLDAVAIAVPPRVQYEIAKIALLQGLHVFAEKPLTVTVAEAKELVALVEEKHLTNAVDFIFPEIAEWRKVKELLNAGTYGALKHVAVDWDFLSYDIKNKKTTWKTSVADGGGALSFFFSHGLYYLHYFAGDYEATQATFLYSPDSMNGAEVGIDMKLQFKNGATGSVHFNCASREKVIHKVAFECEKGTIKLSNSGDFVDNFVVEVVADEGISNISVTKDVAEKNDDPRVKIVRKVAARFIAMCITARPTVPSFTEGLRVQELIEQIRTIAKK